uniref:Uncharacterized protein n=1 Tax=Arundo donax TaxID=35708 RepID=A0A0A9AX70_ARUDO
MYITTISKKTAPPITQSTAAALRPCVTKLPLAGCSRRPFHVHAESLLQLLVLQRMQRLVGAVRRRHCLVGVEHLLIPSKRLRRSAKVHHPSTVAHLACRHLQPLHL